MKLFFCLVTLLSVAGCDGPRYQQRFPGGFQTIIPDGGDDDGGWPDYHDGAELPEEIRHCNWNEYMYGSPHLGGEYTLCQSKKRDGDLFIKLGSVEKDENDAPIKICFFPSHIEDGETALVGNAECPRVSDGGIHRVILSKEPGSPSINAVIVVKDKLYRYERPFPSYEVEGPWAFQKCMSELQSNQDGKWCDSFRKKEEYLSHQF